MMYYPQIKNKGMAQSPFLEIKNRTNMENGTPNSKVQNYTYAVGVLCWSCLNNIPHSSFNNTNVFPHDSGGGKSKIKVSPELISGKTSLLGLRMAPSHWILTWPIL